MYMCDFVCVILHSDRFSATSTVYKNVLLAKKSQGNAHGLFVQF